MYVQYRVVQRFQIRRKTRYEPIKRHRYDWKALRKQDDRVEQILLLGWSSNGSQLVTWREGQTTNSVGQGKSQTLLLRDGSSGRNGVSGEEKGPATKVESVV